MSAPRFSVPPSAAAAPGAHGTRHRGVKRTGPHRRLAAPANFHRHTRARPISKAPAPNPRALTKSVGYRTAIVCCLARSEESWEGGDCCRVSGEPAARALCAAERSRGDHAHSLGTSRARGERGWVLHGNAGALCLMAPAEADAFTQRGCSVATRPASSSPSAGTVPRAHCTRHARVKCPRHHQRTGAAVQLESARPRPPHSKAPVSKLLRLRMFPGTGPRSFDDGFLRKSLGKLAIALLFQVSGRHARFARPSGLVATTLTRSGPRERAVRGFVSVTTTRGP